MRAAVKVASGDGRAPAVLRWTLMSLLKVDRVIHSAFLNAQLQSHFLQSGFIRHLHCRENHELGFFGVAVATAASCDTGVAHATEHLVGCGSSRFPEQHSFAAILRDPDCLMMNNFTGPDTTLYCLQARSGQSLFRLVDRFLDGIFFPLMRPNNFDHEIHDGSGGTNGDPKGAMIGEMRHRSSDLRFQTNRAVLAALFPHTHYAHAYSGDPDAIARLHIEDVWAFHAERYIPRNMLVFSAGAFDPRPLQDKLIEMTLRRKGNDSPPARLRAMPIAAPRNVEARDFPRRAASQNLLAWACPDPSTPANRAALRILAHALWRNPAAGFRSWLLNWSTSCKLAPGTGVIEDLNRSTIAIGIDGPTFARSESFEVEMLKVLDNFDDDEALAAAANRAELDLKASFANHATRQLRVFQYASSAFAFDLDPLASASVDLEVAFLRLSTHTPETVSQLIKRWLVDNVSRVTVQQEKEPSIAKSVMKVGKTPSPQAVRQKLQVNDQAGRGTGHRLRVWPAVGSETVIGEVGFHLEAASKTDLCLLSILAGNLPFLKNARLTTDEIASAAHIFTQGISDKLVTYQSPGQSGPTQGVAFTWTYTALSRAAEDSFALVAALLTGAQLDVASVRAAIERSYARLRAQMMNNPSAFLAAVAAAPLSWSARWRDAASGRLALSTMQDLRSRVRDEPADIVRQMERLRQTYFTAGNLFGQLECSPADSRGCQIVADKLAARLPLSTLPPTLEDVRMLTRPAPLWTGVPWNSKLAVLQLALPVKSTDISSVAAGFSLANALSPLLFQSIRLDHAVYAVRTKFDALGGVLFVETAADPAPDRTVARVRSELRRIAEGAVSILPRERATMTVPFSGLFDDQAALLLRHFPERLPTPADLTAAVHSVDSQQICDLAQRLVEGPYQVAIAMDRELLQSLKRQAPCPMELIELDAAGPNRHPAA